MTQEEQYWYEKRLYMQADAKEREIKDLYNRRLRGLDFRSFRNEEEKRWQRRMIEGECHSAIDFARLKILEPILDEQQKSRLQFYREQEIGRAQREKEEAERKRKEWEKQEREQRERVKREREYRERIQKEAEERKIRAEKEARERAIKEAQERKIREEKEAKERAKQKNIGCFLMFLLIVAAIIVFFSVFV